MSGQQEQRPRWKRALDEENDAMGMVLGRIFVKQYFPEASKQRYTAMVEAIRGTFHDRIERLDWMGADTKAKALAKLAAVTPKVGYPDKWKDYSALVVGRDSYAANVMAAQRWQFNDNLAKFGKPVDRTEWDMTPQTYNAYYNPSNNEIVLPAAMFMVPGVPDAQVDDAVAYGYVGRGHDRPRDHPRLRRPGPPVRRAGQPVGLVDGAGRRALQHRRAEDGRRSSTPTSRCRACTSTARRAWARTSPTTAACCSAWKPSRRPSSTSRARRSAGSRRRSVTSSATRSAG